MKGFSFIISMLFTFLGYSQTRNVNIDSIRDLVDVEVHDSFTINNLLYLSYLERSYDPNASIKYAEMVREEAMKIPFEEAFLKSYYMKATVYNNSSEYDKAKAELDTLITYNAIQKYPEVECDCYKALGMYYADNFNYADAFLYLKKAIEIGKKINDFGCHGGCLITLGSLHENLQNNVQALKYYNEALKSLQNTDRPHITAEVFFSISNLLENSNEKMAALDSAIFYGNQADNNILLHIAHHHKAILEKENNNLTAAKIEYAVADSFISTVEYNASDASFFADYALFLLQNKELQEARNKFQLALTLGEKSKAIAFHDAVSHYYELKNNFVKALDHRNTYSLLMDSLTKVKILNSFIGQDLEYQTELKDKQILAQQLELSKEKEKQNKLAGIGAAIFLLFLGLGSWYYQKQSARKKLSEIALESEKKEREKLQELDELKTRFFINVSHELKTPLTLILGPLSNTLEKIENDVVKEEVLLAYNNAEKLHNLINETLDFSKLESGSVEIENKPVLIAESIKRSFYSFQSLAEMRNISLLFSSDVPEETYAMCDYDKMEKIINNLVSNAIKFSENNSLVTLEITMDELFNIRVIDLGKGIATDEQDKIFNRFYQAKHNQSGNFGGTGVGLAFSKELAELMGGSLEVKSLENKGSTFTFSLPLQFIPAPETNILDEVGSEVTTHSGYEPLLIDGEKPSILIVEDNPEMQKYLLSLLEDQYQCSMANDGYEAIRMVQKKSFHLISSDIMMPNMDGFRLKSEINNLRGYGSIPFIFLSARSHDEDVLEGLQLGVDDYITKPFNKQEYLVRIFNLLKNSKERIASKEVFGDNEYTESVDLKIMKEVEKIILENLSNTAFKVSDLAEALHYSQRQLGRIINQLTGMSPVELILELRLQKAHRLIKRKQFSSVSQVRDEVGIESPSYFARKFKARFGISPSEVR